MCITHENNYVFISATAFKALDDNINVPLPSNWSNFIALSEKKSRFSSLSILTVGVNKLYQSFLIVFTLALNHDINTIVYSSVQLVQIHLQDLQMLQILLACQ